MPSSNSKASRKRTASALVDPSDAGGGHGDHGAHGGFAEPEGRAPAIGQELSRPPREVVVVSQHGVEAQFAEKRNAFRRRQEGGRIARPHPNRILG